MSKKNSSSLAQFFVVAVLAVCAPFSVAKAEGLVSKQSAHSVTETLDKLEALVKQKGMTVFARIDHKANAKASGAMMLASQVLIFGSARTAARIVWHDPKAALDLPLRVLAYKDADDKVWLVYRRPMSLNDDFAVDQCASVGDVDSSLDKLTSEVVK
jgi:uncharacterized protein (DUF302 family)